MKRRTVTFTLLVIGLALIIVSLSVQLARRAVYQSLTFISHIENANGQYDDALRHSSVALSYNSGLASGHWSRCVALSHLNRYDEALIECTLAIEKPPFRTKHPIYADRANVYTQLAQYQHAVEDLSRALREAALPDYYYQRGNAYVLLGDSNEARADYRAALDLALQNPDEDELIVLIRVALEGLGP